MITKPQEKRKKMEVVEDFVSIPHKAVSFVEERDQEIQEWREQKMPEALTGFSGGKLPGRSKAEKTEEEDEEKEIREGQMRSEETKEVVAMMMKKVDTIGGTGARWRKWAQNKMERC